MAQGNQPSQTRDAGPLAAIYRKVTLRLLPFLGLCYLAAYLDRVNVGFAHLRMASQLGLSDTAYGLGAGVFFLGYVLFEVPSNLILHRVGARTWLTRIMITWALISAAMALLGPLRQALGAGVAEDAFYGLRFLLGSAEAGFFPGVLLYLGYWFPPSRQSLALALFILAQPVAFIFGAPLSGLILDRCDGLGGLNSWQWMYLFEAAPALLLGLCLPLRLDNRVADARWLSAAERAMLADAIEGEAVPGRVVRLRDMARNGLVWMLAAAYFLLTLGAYGLNFWVPSIVKATGVKSDLSIGLLTAIPYFVGVLAMLSLGARTSTPDAARRRAALMCAVGACGLAMSAAFTSQFQGMLAGLSIGVAGVLSATVLFWSVPSLALQGRAVAAGLAGINAFGNVGGFVGPYLMGAMTQRFGDSRFGLYALAGLLVCAGAVLLGAGLRLEIRAGDPYQ